MPGNDVGGRLFNFDVGRNAFVLDDPAVLGPDGQVGRRHVAAVHEDREPERPDEAAPGPLPYQCPQFELAEHPGQEVAARAGRFVDEHDLRPLNRGPGRLQVRAVAHVPVGDHGPAQNVDVVIGDQAAAVEPFVDDDGVLVGLGEEVAFEVDVSGLGRVRHVDVGHPAVRRLVDLPHVPFHPVPVPQGIFVRDGDDPDRSRARTVRVGTDRDLDDLSGGVLEPGVKIVRRPKVFTVHRQ